ncbi:MAG: bifunctional phosphoribosyl-AMP cyclohydrolase/phosphoribosyl-ATP diphosphatase HisIE [Calditrichaeota bacterium]|nr:MAG: bifunctional phosphoribosyl-AMP cyclohydrolase/phosphoribosyl-ATP diphosphatase HisIE [Calditrichota bacterium]
MVVASIDLMQGKAVQLRQGRDKALEVDSPPALAETFDRYGEVAVIDLDAAMGTGDNRAVIRQILARAECRVGGGIGTVDEAREWISRGARKVIIGSKAFENDRVNHDFLKALAEAISPQRVIIAVDALKGEIVTRGWKHRTGLNLYDTVPQLEKYAGEFLFTCVEREGMMQGIDLRAVKRLRRCTRRKITVAGGVSRLEEIQTLAEMKVDVQLGMALYTGAVDLGEAFIASLNWSKAPLIPTIVQDVQGQVLMLAYSNPESLRRSFAGGRMCYYSRSRQQLWYKGDTSGHVQHLVRLRADCDRDTLLATVQQSGAACHLGSYSCFGERRFSLEELQDVISSRLEEAPEGSYTARLRDDVLLTGKILEEAREVVEADTREEVIWEAADVLYFLTVLLAKRGISVQDVLRELYRRRWKGGGKKSMQ